MMDFDPRCHTVQRREEGGRAVLYTPGAVGETTCGVPHDNRHDGEACGKCRAVV